MGVNNVDYTLTAMMFSTRRDICKALLLFNESDVEGKDLHSTKMYKYFKYLILSGICTLHQARQSLYCHFVFLKYKKMTSDLW